MGIISCNCESIQRKDNLELTTGPSEETPRFPIESYKDTDKIKYIQKIYRGYSMRKRFNDQIDALSTIVYLDLNINLIKNPMVINANCGEMVSQKLEKEGSIQSFPKKDIMTSRYMRDSDLSYIDKYKSHDMYIGTWSIEKKFKGYGILYKDNTKYEGIWDNGVLNGFGRYFLPNGDYFEGNFIQGVVEGRGVYHHSDGNVYIGEWLNDYPNGEGKEIFKDGSIFEGIFVKGKKINGCFTWNDSSSYSGEILNELFEGEGTFKWKEKREYQGQWKEGLMNGKGVLKFQDGSVYEGSFLNGKRSGFGKYTWNKDKFYEGEWSDGKQNGPGKYYKNGIVTQGVWSCGRMMNLSEGSIPPISTISQSDTTCLNHLNEKCIGKGNTKLKNLKKNLL